MRRYFAIVRHESGQTRTHTVWADTFEDALKQVRDESKALGDLSTSRVTELAEVDLSIDSAVLRERAKG
jgi:hypothetical protein